MGLRQTRFVRLARNTRGVSDLVFEQQVVTTVASAVRLYWDLVSLNNEDVIVRDQALERAERLLADTDAHAQVGTRAAIDVVRARADVARGRRDLIGGYGSVLEQLANRSFPDVVVGLRMTIPLRNRAAQADYARDQIVARQQELRVHQIEKQIRVEIESALVGLEQARGSVEAARQEREYQELALAGETDRIDVGASATYWVIQYQRDVAQARSAEVTALAAYAKARAAIARASGQLLDTFAISVRAALDSSTTATGRRQQAVVR